MQLIWFKVIQNAVVLALSIFAFAFSDRFYNLTEDTTLPEAPKAT